MNLKTRLTFQSTLLFSIILGSTLFISYSLFRRHTDKMFYDILYERAFLAGIIFLEKDELSRARYMEYEKLYEEKIPDEQVQVFDSLNAHVFIERKSSFHVSPEIIQQIRDNYRLFYQHEDRHYAGLFYEDNQGDFVIIASSGNTYGQAQLRKLRNILVIGFFTGTIIILLLTIRLSANTYLPFERIIRKVNSITSDNLHIRLREPETRNELQELISTFNYFLNRLEKSTKNQKHFVRQVSHELKTPLASVIGNLEVVLEEERRNEEYKQIIGEVLSDTYRMKSVLDGLLMLSGLENIDPANLRHSFLLDELLWDVLEKLKLKYPEAKVKVVLPDAPDKSAPMEITGNRDLLMVAVSNIIDNAIKFSGNKPVVVKIKKEKSTISLEVGDKGPGIPSEEIPRIFDLFYRCNKTSNIPGYGIGLSLARNILDLHKIPIEVKSEAGKGTKVRMSFYFDHL